MSLSDVESLSNVETSTTVTRSNVSLAEHPTDAGVLHLEPVQASSRKETIAVAIRLHGADGRIRVGDLRAAAEALDEQEEFEAAHRLWTVVGTAAFTASDFVLARKADECAERSLRRANDDGVSGPARLVKYDYDALVASRQSGMSIAATAQRWRCSPTTVKRATQYVEIRDTMLAERPGLVPAIEAGVDVSELASRYDVEPKIMRWIVVSHFDRRSVDRDT